VPDFVSHDFDPAAARVQLSELRQFLAAHPELSERGELLPFVRARPHLTALFGIYNPNQSRYDLLAREYPLFGEFRCDFAVGDSAAKSYAFVELEDARAASIFIKKKGKFAPEWSPRFEHGYSQVVDWFYKLQTMTDTPDMEARLGKRAVIYTGVVVVGRDQHLSAGERLRLDWRREHVVVNSKKVVCVTYDQLCDDLGFRLDSFSQAAQAGPP
jgi:hypothetical protein